LKKKKKMYTLKILEIGIWLLEFYSKNFILLGFFNRIFESFLDNFGKKFG
jgi:hypothetical protein